MKFEELKKSLVNGLKPAYFIFGEDVDLLYSALNLLENACNITMPDFNKVVFGPESNMQEVIESCQVLPIMDTKRLVVIKHYSGKGSDTEKKYLQNYLDNPSQDTCFVMFATKNVPLFVSVLNKVEPVDCNKLSPETLGKVIVSKFTQGGKKIEKLAVDYLIEACSGSFTAISKEIEKLLSFAGESEVITLKMAETLVAKSIENVVYDLTNAIAEKNGSKVYSIVNNLLDHGNMPTALISLITNQFRRLFFVSITEGENAELAKHLGVKEGAVYIAKKQAKAFGPKTLKLICEKCVDAEFKIKNGKMEGVNAINYLLAEILSF